MSVHTQRAARQAARGSAARDTTPAQHGWRRSASRWRRSNPLAALGGLAWLAVVAIPLYRVFITSLRSQSGFFASGPLTPPHAPTVANYRLALANSFGTYLRNSVIVTVATVAIILVVTAMAGYGIARGGGRRLPRSAFALFLLGLAIPLQATIIPIYYVITRLHLYDTLLALILPSAAFAIPVTVIILVNFLRDVPDELFQAMRVDGAGDWRMLWSLAIPLIRPALVTVAVYDSLQVWNGFLFPLILTQSNDLQVLPLALFNYQGQYTVNVPAILVLGTVGGCALGSANELFQGAHTPRSEFYASLAAQLDLTALTTGLVTLIAASGGALATLFGATMALWVLSTVRHSFTTTPSPGAELGPDTHEVIEQSPVRH